MYTQKRNYIYISCHGNIIVPHAHRYLQCYRLHANAMLPTITAVKAHEYADAIATRCQLATQITCRNKGSDGSKMPKQKKGIKMKSSNALFKI